MNIFLREIKANFKNLFFWFLGMAFLISAGMAKSTGFTSSNNSGGLTFLDSLPKGLKAFMGVDLFTLGVSIGFYGIVYTYIILIAAVHGGFIGYHLMAKEEGDKTFEFLYTKPIERSSIFRTKLLAGLVNVILLNILTGVTSILACNQFLKANITSDIIKLMVSMLFIQLTFFALGTFLGTVFSQKKTGTIILNGIIIGLFIVGLASDLKASLAWFKYISPFKYFSAAQVMGPGMPAYGIWITGVFVVLMLGFAFYFHKRKDLKV